MIASERDGLVVLGADGRIVEVNDVFCGIVGRERVELIGMSAPFPFAAGGEEVFALVADGPVERTLIAEGRPLRVWVSVTELVVVDGSRARAAVIKSSSQASEPSRLAAALREIAVADGAPDAAAVAELVAARLAAAALANTQAQEQLRFRARLEEALQEVAVASASGQLGERALATLAAERVAGLLHAPSAAVVRFDGDRAITLGSADPLPLPVVSSLAGRSAAAQVARTAKPVVVEDYRELGESVVELAQEQVARGAITVPVFVGGQLWGALGAISPDTGFGDDQVQWLERFAALISAALANAQAQARLAREASVERALREVAAARVDQERDADALFELVARRVAELAGAAAGMVVRVLGETAVIVGRHGLSGLPDTAPLAQTTVGARAIATARPARVDDYGLEGNRDAIALAAASGYRSTVAVPVQVRDRPWGYISVANARPRSFAPETEELLERFATLVASALAEAQALASLHQQAITDGLTGLLNHRAFQERLHEENRRARRSCQPLALAIFDLDNFKEINDTHGHQAGDAVLQAVARAFAEHKRTGDIAARVGGDEFAIIAPDTNAEEARRLAERLRHAATSRLELPVTLSAGVTDLSSAANVRDLFHLADSALYWAKHNGRDQTISYTPGAAHAPTDHQRQRLRQRAQTRAGLLALVRGIDAKEPGGQDHGGRVAEIAGALALRLGWSLERCAELREAALLHDIGKIAIPDAILNKPGRLTADEYEQIKTHAQLGAEIASGALNDTQTSWLRSHHETPDGRGYPDALPAASIPDGAQVIAIADAFDAITTGRPYQAAIPAADALREMRAHAGTQFDATLLHLLETYIHDTGQADTTSDPEAAPTRTAKAGPSECP